MIARLAIVAVLWAATSDAAFAVFSAASPSVPEPATTGLLAAGVLLVGGLRYLTKRRK